MARVIASWAVYPAMMIATLATGVVALARGWSPFVTIAAVTVAAAAIIVLLERWLPYERDWQRSHGDFRTDVCHAFITGALVEPIRVVSMAAIAAGAVWLAARIGSPLWPHAWPLYLELPLALVVAELGGYWGHRLQHQTRLWRFHAVHHSVTRLYWLNAMRIHPGDHLIAMTLSMFPLALLGAGEEVLTLFALYAGVHMLLQHSNIDARLGPLNWIFSMTEVHRWHHASSFSVMNCNYGTILLLWDVIFGTRYFPADRAVGARDVEGLVDMPDYPKGYWGQIASPFRRALWHSVEPAE